MTLDLPDLKVFEEGNEKDYIFEERKNIPILQAEQGKKFNIVLNNIEKNVKKTGLISGKSRILLTMRGAIKFNMWKE